MSARSFRWGPDPQEVEKKLHEPHTLWHFMGSPGWGQSKLMYVKFFTGCNLHSRCLILRELSSKQRSRKLISAAIMVWGGQGAIN